MNFSLPLITLSSSHVLFTIKANDRTYRNIRAIYLSGFSPEERQSFDCRECLQILTKIASIVTIEPTQLTPIWLIDPSQMGAYQSLFIQIRDWVMSQPIDKLFLTSTRSFGFDPFIDNNGNTQVHFSTTLPNVIPLQDMNFSLQKTNNQKKNAIKIKYILERFTKQHFQTLLNTLNTLPSKSNDRRQIISFFITIMDKIASNSSNSDNIIRYYSSIAKYNLFEHFTSGIFKNSIKKIKEDEILPVITKEINFNINSFKYRKDPLPFDPDRNLDGLLVSKNLTINDLKINHYTEHVPSIDANLIYIQKKLPPVPIPLRPLPSVKKYLLSNNTEMSLLNFYSYIQNNYVNIKSIYIHLPKQASFEYGAFTKPNNTAPFQYPFTWYVSNTEVSASLITRPYNDNNLFLINSIIPFPYNQPPVIAPPLRHRKGKKKHRRRNPRVIPAAPQANNPKPPYFHHPRRHFAERKQKRFPPNRYLIELPSITLNTKFTIPNPLSTYQIKPDYKRGFSDSIKYFNEQNTIQQRPGICYAGIVVSTPKDSPLLSHIFNFVIEYLDTTRETFQISYV
jgi:hypothetical protein